VWLAGYPQRGLLVVYSLAVLNADVGRVDAEALGAGGDEWTDG